MQPYNTDYDRNEQSYDVNRTPNEYISRAFKQPKVSRFDKSQNEIVFIDITDLALISHNVFNLYYGCKLSNKDNLDAILAARKQELDEEVRAYIGHQKMLNELPF